MAGLSLSRLLRDFPDIKVKKVEYLANLGRSREEGVHSIPTFVSGEKKQRQRQVEICEARIEALVKKCTNRKREAGVLNQALVQPR